MSEFFATLWTHGADGMAFVQAGRIDEANATFASLVGAPEEAIAGQRLEDLLEPIDESIQVLSDVSCGRSRQPLTARAFSGASIVELRCFPHEDGRHLLVLRDITTLHRAVLELRQKRVALEESLNGYDIVSAEGQFLYANRAYLDMWGYDHVDEILGASPAGHCADPKVALELIRAVEQHGRATREFKGLRKDGSTFDVMMAVQMSNDERGNKVYIGTSLDISEIKRLRSELFQFQKVEAIGAMAANIAHDSNNLLLPILTYAELLLRDKKIQGVAREHVEDIKLAASRLSEMTARLLAMGRKQILESRPTDLGQLVRGEEKLLRTTLRENVRLSVHHRDESVCVVIDPTQFQQLLLNLVTNAQDAMPDGGELSIEVGQRELDAEYCKSRIDVSPGAFGELVVSDTGQGMSAETLERVFEPFFTTKGSFGTGLGLASVHGIVKQHRGNLWVYSEVGHGTTFKVYFPLSDQPPRPTEIPQRTESTDVDALILVVEDNAMVRKAARRVLAGAGYRIHAVGSGEEALEWLRTNETLPDLLLTDVILGDTSGRTLATSARLVHPALRVLFMSGYTDNVISHHGVVDSGIDLITKPFTASELVQRVRWVLGADCAEETPTVR